MHQPPRRPRSWIKANPNVRMTVDEEKLYRPGKSLKAQQFMPPPDRPDRTIMGPKPMTAKQRKRSKIGSGYPFSAKSNDSIRARQRGFRNGWHS